MALVDSLGRYIKMTPYTVGATVGTDVVMYIDGTDAREKEKSIKEQADEIVSWLETCHDELYEPVCSFLESIGIDTSIQPQEGEQEAVLRDYPQIIPLVEEFTAKDMAARNLQGMFMWGENGNVDAILPIVSSKFGVPQDEIVPMADKYRPRVYSFSTTVGPAPVQTRSTKMRSASDPLASYVYDQAKAQEMFPGPLVDA